MQEKNTQLQETDTRLQHALLQLQIEQGTVQLFQLRMNAQAEDHTRQCEQAAQQTRCTQEEPCGCW